MHTSDSRNSSQSHFSLWRSLKLGSFHIGSSMTDLLTSAVWNRVLVVDLGVAAWPVALLSALRYLLAPLTLWAGHESDTRPLFGSRRLAYIWLGRLLMLLALPLLPLSIVAIAQDSSSLGGWGLSLGSFLLYGVGTLISGAPFLALVHDSAPYARRGQAISIVQFMLVVSFAFIPAVYAALMPAYEPAAFTRLVGIGMAGGAIFWILSIIGEEGRGLGSSAPVVSPAKRPSFRKAFAALWADTHTRRYALFLGGSAFFAFMQDAMLEPFGGDVFGLPVGATTRFNAYWGAGVLVGMVGTLLATRRRPPHRQVGTTAWGLVLLAVPLALLAVTAYLRLLWPVMPVLVLFGLGFGIFTVGGVSLLMAMSRESQAASYLALWSIVQLVSRGAGIASGGIIRDGGLALFGEFHLAYALLFLIEAVGLLASVLLLRRVDVAGFASGQSDTSASDVLAMATD